MIKFPQKKNHKPKTTVRPRHETPRETDFRLIDIVGLACIGIACCGFIVLDAPPTQSIGDITQFDAAMRMPEAGQRPVSATILSNIWGHAIGHCSLDASAMFASKGAMQISAISAQEIVVQWLASAKTPAIGCPPAPALLALSKADYQALVDWAETPNQPRLYK